MFCEISADEAKSKRRQAHVCAEMYQFGRGSGNKTSGPVAAARDRPRPVEWLKLVAT